MTEQNIRLTWVQCAILMPAALGSALAGLYISNYFEFSILAEIAWLVISLCALPAIIVAFDKRHHPKVNNDARIALLLCSGTLAALAFTHTPFYDGMRNAGATAGAYSSRNSSGSGSCKTTVECKAVEFEPLASSRCAAELGKQADAVRWTGGNVLSTYAVDHDHKNRVTYYGDAAEFQVDGPQYQQWTYFCDFDLERGVVMDSGLIVPASLDKVRGTKG